MKKDTDGNMRKYALIMMSGILWGTIGLFVKVLDAKGSTSEYTTFMRMLFAFLLLLAITLAKEGVSSFRIGRSTLISCALLGFVSMSLNNLCYTNAVSRLGMSLAAAILYMAPIFTSIQSKLLFHEKIGRNKLIALAKPKDYTRFRILCESCLEHDAREELDKIKCPVLVIGAAEDKVLGGEASKELAAAIPDAELYMYEGYSHGVYEQAKDFNARVLKYLKRQK